jgi:hypothetical protein
MHQPIQLSNTERIADLPFERIDRARPRYLTGSELVHSESIRS